MVQKLYLPPSPSFKQFCKGSRHSASALVLFPLPTMPPTKRPSEEAKTGTGKKLVQMKLSFAPRAAAPSSNPPSSSRDYSSSSSSVPSSNYTLSAPFSTPSSSRYFDEPSPSGPSNRRTPKGPVGLFKNPQWVRQDSGGSSPLSSLSLSDKDKGRKDGTEGLDGQEETPRKPKAYGSRYNMERAAIAKETM